MLSACRSAHRSLPMLVVNCSCQDGQLTGDSEKQYELLPLCTRFTKPPTNHRFEAAPLTLHRFKPPSSDKDMPKFLACWLLHPTARNATPLASAFTRRISVECWPAITLAIDTGFWSWGLFVCFRWLSCNRIFTQSLNYAHTVHYQTFLSCSAVKQSFYSCLYAVARSC